MEFSVLIADLASRRFVERLEDEGLIADFYPTISPEELLRVISKYDALAIRSRTKVTKEVIQRAKTGGRLKMIGRIGAGVDNIDVDEASRANILVVNAAIGNENAVAEFAVAQMLAVCRGTSYADREFKEGHWVKTQMPKGRELAGKTLGIIGFGKIGKLVAARVAGFEMQILAYDPYVNSAPPTVRMVLLEELLEQSDLVTLHIPATMENRNFLNAERLSRMKKGAVLINTARGGLVDESALHELLKKGHLAGAACDVFEKEEKDFPPHPFPELYRRPDFIGSPHIAARTQEAEERTGERVAENIILFLKHGIIRDAVNANCIDEKRFALLKPHRVLAGRLADFLRQMCHTDDPESDEKIEGIDVYFGTEFAADELPVLMRIVLREVLGYGYVSSTIRASDDKVKWYIIGNSEQGRRIRVTLKKGKKVISAIGKADDDDTPLLKGVDAFSIHAPLTGDFILFVNEDTPGVWAKATALVHAHGLNKNEIHGKGDEIKKLALTVIYPEEKQVISDGLIQDLQGLSEIKFVRKISLPK